MEIQNGEYIRTTDGIKKIIKVNEGSNATYYGKYIVEPKYKGSNSINAKNIIKHSFNIIDLIEVGDIVDGFKVFGIFERKRHEKVVCDTPDDDFYGNFATNKDIFSVVTKEQFQAMEYEVK